MDSNNNLLYIQYIVQYRGCTEIFSGEGMKQKKIDKMPARLDFIQSVTGLILGLFIMGHIVFEASILVSNEMMYKVTVMFEGYYFLGETHPLYLLFMLVWL